MVLLVGQGLDKGVAGAKVRNDYEFLKNFKMVIAERLSKWGVPWDSTVCWTFLPQGRVWRQQSWV